MEFYSRLVRQTPSCGSTGSTTKYQISISAVPSNGGSVSPTGGKYKEGKKLDISATPADSSWRFDHWSGDYQGTSSSATITINKTKNIKAHFSKKNFDLTVNTKGEGTVEQNVLKTSSAKGYETGTTVELMAKPSEGWKFVKWTGDLTGSKNPDQITVDKAKEVTAVFEKKSYQLTINTKGQGAVKQEVVQTSAAANYDYDTTVRLTANPAKGWKFDHWSGDLNGSKNPDQITIDNPKEVTAVFVKKSFAINISIRGQGSVAKDPNKDSYIYDSTVDLTAKPAEGYKFVKWTGDINTEDNPVSVTAGKDKDITAVFEKKSYALTINTDGKGSVTKDPDQEKYTYKTTVDLKAKPNQGWKFVKWKGNISTTDNPTEITVDEAKKVTAVFKQIGYTVNIKLDGSGSVKKELVNGTKVSDGFAYDSKVKVTVNPDNGYNFVHWNGDFSGTDNPQIVTVKDSIKATASLDKSPFAGGDGSKKYPYQIATLTQLQSINNFTKKHFVQINNIDASATKNWNGGKGFKPIGDDVIQFEGSFNGNNFSISNIFINRSETYVGLFGFIDDGIIENLRLLNIDITSTRGVSRTGGIVGSNDGKVNNSYVNGEINGTLSLGGIAGLNRGVIFRSSVDINIKGSNTSIGGLVGSNLGTIKQSSVNGMIESPRHRIGGLVGTNEGTVRNSYSKGNVTGEKSVGGLVGTSKNNGQIISSYAIGNTSGTSDIGGLVGTNGSEIKTSYWNTQTSNQNIGVGRGSADGTTGLKTSQMTGNAAEDNMPKLDFSKIWVTTNSYPILQWQK